jgi:hypothetical protein
VAAQGVMRLQHYSGCRSEAEQWEATSLFGKPAVQWSQEWVKKSQLNR